MNNESERLNMRVDEFDYDLPPDLIAQTPMAQRDSSRLMVVDRSSGSIEHGAIRSLPDRLAPGDLLVVNNTRVLPARIYAHKRETGGRVELLLLHRDPSGVWTCLAKPSKVLRPGIVLESDQQGELGSVEIYVVENRGEGEVAIRFGTDSVNILDRIGVVPLPPYIRAPLETAERYQTVYARVSGSAAAPTAGLHITEQLRSELVARGIGWAEVTLHIGLDTFRPVTVDAIEEHKIHREWCSVSAETAQAILETKNRGGRVVAVGTTSARTLETWAPVADQPAAGYEGWSELFITPGYRWQVVDAMLTNFHLPRSTLLMMISSFAGLELVRTAYQLAIAERYRFFSFGDAMLLL